MSESRCLIVAEAGVNHNGDLGQAKRLIEVAAAAAVDAVKFQTFKATRLASGSAPTARYQVQATGGTESQVAMLQRLELSEAHHRELARYCAQNSVEFLSTPFDEASVDLLCSLGVARLKVSSGDVTNLPLLRHIGRAGKPVILSTGMSYLAEVDRAIQTLEQAGCSDLTLLHCTSQYPAEPTECNLRAIESLRAGFGLPVGYSDHTAGIEVACAAVALGATIVEKHVTLARSLHGPDHQASIEPMELEALVTAIRRIESALGDGFKRPVPAEGETRILARRSLTATRDLAAGEVLQQADVIAKRPGTGISPEHLDRVIGRRLAVAIRADQAVQWEHLA